MNERFPAAAESAFIGYKMFPSKISSEEIQAIEVFYGPDLPCKEIFQAEVEVWKAKCP